MTKVGDCENDYYICAYRNCLTRAVEEEANEGEEWPGEDSRITLSHSHCITVLLPLLLRGGNRGEGCLSHLSQVLRLGPGNPKLLTSRALL